MTRREAERLTHQERVLLDLGFECPKCHATRVVRANSFIGRTARPGVGAIWCDGPIPNFATRLSADKS